DGIDLVELTVADEHGALVTEPQRARIGDAAGIDLDLKALGQLELRDRQLVRWCREWRRRGATQLGRHFGTGDVWTVRHGGGLRLHDGYRCCPLRGCRRLGCRRGRSWLAGRLLLRLLREPWCRHQQNTKDSDDQKTAQG